MKNLLLISVVVVSAGSTYAQTPDSVLLFEELPFSEGTLYLQMNDGDKDVLMKAVEVDEAEVSLSINLNGLVDRELSVKAFLDLNENAVLDFDNFGRPTEPCIQTIIIPKEGVAEYKLRLVQY